MKRVPLNTKGKTGVHLIAEERQRQIEKEGWTAEHDDEHVNGELAAAASCYALLARLQALDECEKRIMNFEASRKWPWDFEFYKPKSQLSNLIRSGALIVAEIDRLQREASEQS